MKIGVSARGGIGVTAMVPTSENGGRGLPGSRVRVPNVRKEDAVGRVQCHHPPLARDLPQAEQSMR